MKKTLLTAAMAVFALLAVQAHAAAGDCAAQAADKKLAGAAKTSFIKKCEKDAAAATATPATSPACEKAATEKKLYGAAKASFVKKCTADEAAAAKK